MNLKLFRSFLVVMIPVAALIVIDVATAVAQGTVLFDNRIVGTLITHVYLPSPNNPGLVQTGNGPSDFPPGTTVWTGWVPISGDGFSAQLFAANGADAPVESLVPALPTTVFRTGAFAGILVDTTATLAGVPNNAPVATIQMRVWDNKGGTITDWATALAQPPGTELVGTYPPINVRGIGGNGPPPGALLGLQSFNLIYNIPEPSSIEIAGLGGLLLWLARLWNKQSAPAFTLHKTKAKQAKQPWIVCRMVYP